MALQLAYQHPELCERLVLVASGGLGRELSPLLRMLSLPGSELVLPLVAPAFVAERGQAVNVWLHTKGVRSGRLAEMWRAYASLADAENRRAFVRTLRSVVDMGGQVVSARDRLYLASAVPTLIVWGDRDEIIPVAHGRAAHDMIPGSRLEVFDGVGHFPQSEDPARFVAVLLGFMATTTPASGGTARLRELLAEGAE